MKANKQSHIILFLIVSVVLVTFFLTWFDFGVSSNVGLVVINVFIVLAMIPLYYMIHRIVDSQSYAPHTYRYQGNLDLAGITKRKQSPNILARKLTHAIEDDLIDIYFQKIIDTRTGGVLYMEQLARWNDKDLGLIVPDALFKLARNTDQVLKLDKYLIKKSIMKYKSYCKKNEHQPKLALNLTPESFLNVNTIDYLLDTLKKYHVAPNDVCLEIAETTFMNDHGECIRFINVYKNHDFLVALDDFGKSYSSLGILESIDCDVIKIDRLFLENIAREKTQEIVRMIQKIATISSQVIVVEGVETEAEKEILEQLKCTVLQGYLLHRPEKY